MISIAQRSRAAGADFFPSAGSGSALTADITSGVQF
jgi:hypothetical protein